MHDDRKFLVQLGLCGIYFQSKFQDAPAGLNMVDKEQSNAYKRQA
jgi:hypothetical protein